MWTRRSWLAAATSPLWPCPSGPARPLAWSDLPPGAAPLAAGLQLTAASWPSYLSSQQNLLASRVHSGTAEHLTCYILQSRRFTSLPALAPLQLAASGVLTPDARVQARIDAFSASGASPLDARHRLLIDLYKQLPVPWDLQACYRHTMEFLRARLAEARTQEEIDSLYQSRGLSSDTSPANTATLTAAWPLIKPAPRSALLIGPGLDLTRREGFSDEAPLAQPQLDRLLALLGPGSRVDCVDVRPEVLAFLRQSGRCGISLDITTHIPAVSAYDLAIATNVLVYNDDRALFSALAALAVALKPGGYLLHNDMRFAAKIFGRALDLPVVHFAPVSLGSRRGVEQMDRIVLHRRGMHSSK